MAGSAVALTGALGAGKTTLARAVQKTALGVPGVEVLFFDSIGVPSAEEMTAFGAGHEPGGAWQRAMTFRWMERIASMRAEGWQSIRRPDEDCLYSGVPRRSGNIGCEDRSAGLQRSGSGREADS